MNFLEKNLEDILFDCLGCDDIHKQKIVKGIDHYHKYIRQQRLGFYGIPDIIGLSIYTKKEKGVRWFEVRIGVYELKKEEINIDTIIQASKYSRGLKYIIIKALFTRFPKLTWEDVKVVNRMYLIGDYIDSNIYNLLEFSDSIDVYTYNYNYDGLKLNKFTQYLPVFSNVIDVDDDMISDINFIFKTPPRYES